MSATGDDLRAAKAELQRRGKYEGSFCPLPPTRDTNRDDWYHNCPVCAIGAMNVVLSPRNWPTDCFTSLRFSRMLAFVSTAVDCDGVVSWWSDTNPLDVVLAGFDRAAELADQEAA